MRTKRTSEREEHGFRVVSDTFDGDDTLIDDLPSIDDFEELSGEAEPGPERRRDPLRR